MKLGFIGMGNIARAAVTGLLGAHALPARDVYACAAHYERVKAYADETGITACPGAAEVLQACDTLVIAVKPQVVEAALAPFRAEIAGKNLLSFVYGWDLDKYLNFLGANARVQYLLPNTPCATGEGILLAENRHTLPANTRETLFSLLSCLGLIEELPSSLMRAGTAVASCGPAFIAMAIEALADAGVKYGLPREAAYHLASQMARGTGALQLQTQAHPGRIKDGVCSPGGVTIRGVEALERAGMRAAFFEAINAVMA